MKKYIKIIVSIILVFIALLFLFSSGVTFLDLRDEYYPVTSFLAGVLFISIALYCIFFLLYIWNKTKLRRRYFIFAAILNLCLGLLINPISTMISNRGLQTETTNTYTESEYNKNEFKETETWGKFETQMQTQQQPSSDTEQENAFSEQVTVTSGKEILFRGIPWNTTHAETKKALEKECPEGHLYSISDVLVPYPECILDSFPLQSIAQGGTSLLCSQYTAGGYDLSTMQLYFSYTVENDLVNRERDEFYAARYVFNVLDHETVYESLRKKLTSLYGEGVEEIQTSTSFIAAWDYSGAYEENIIEVTWLGANNTAVKLCWISSDNMAESVQMNCGISMAYYKTDHVEQLDELLQTLKEEQRAEDREKSQSENKDGL